MRLGADATPVGSNMVKSARVHVVSALLVMLLAGCGGGTSAPPVPAGPSVVVVPSSGLITTESGGIGSVGIVLSAAPSADVTIAVSSSNTAEGVVAPASVTFTSGNWNVVQVVTVTGVDDAVEDGDVAYTVVTAPASSTDGDYNGVNPIDVAAINADDDLASIVVTPVAGLTTTEAGGNATFTVVLGSQPSADVTIALTSNDTAEGSISPASLIFTAANFATPQTVTVTGVDDNIDDGNQPFTVSTAAAVSTDPNFAGKNAADVALVNNDDDTAGITVSTVTGSTTESGASTTFTVVLDTRPAVDVTVPLSSNDLTEGTVAPSSVTFTPANWDTAQTVTVTGVDDSLVDGNITYAILTAPAVSADGAYSGVDAANVAVTNNDNDAPGISVNPASGLTTTEAGGTATFTIALLAQPTADVTIPLSSDNTAEGTVSPASITFTAADFATPRTVTVTGVDDSVVDGDIGYNILTNPAVSGDAGYSGLNGIDAAVTNLDDDQIGITVGPISGNTTEAGLGTATFTVVLASQPSADVTLALTTSDGSEGTVVPASMTFTVANFATPQVATVTGANDDLDDGDIAYTIFTGPATSTDTGYSGFDANDVAVINEDDDTAGFAFGAPSGTTTEAGGTATFTVALTSEPTASVTIGLSSSDPSEGALPQGSNVIFSNTNWNIPQTVTVTGVDDSVDDGDIVYRILTAPAISGDIGYSGLNPADPALTNTDDDTAGAVLSAASGPTTEATLATATFTIQLSSEPTSSVIIDLASDDPSEGTVPPGSSVIFTPTNWNIPQTVTVTGVNDDVDDGDIGYAIVTSPATSADPNYSTLDVADAAVTNIDDDTAGITVTPIAGLTTTESGGTATFTVVLTSEPTGGVGVDISSDDMTEGTVSPTTVTFTTLDWSTPRTVTITGVDDVIVDGPVTYHLLTGQATTTDLKYSAINPPDVTAVNTDNELSGVVFVPDSAMLTAETGGVGGTASGTIRLATVPTADVTLTLVSSDPTEGVVNAPTSLIFTPGTALTPQPVSITGVDDVIADGDVAYSIITTVTSADTNYDGSTVAPISVTNIDNEPAAASLSGNVTYGGSKTGPVFLQVTSGGVVPTGYGTGIASAPGSYTIRGVPAGTYTVVAWIDHVGRGVRTADSPSGSVVANASTGGAITGLNIALTDPVGVTPIAVSLAPKGVPGDGTVALSWDVVEVGAPLVENADSYNVYWGTTAAVSKTANLGSVTGIPAQGNGLALINGLTNGTSYFFTVTAVTGGMESVESPVSAAVVPAIPGGGFTLSGTVTLPTGFTTAGPLLVGYANPAGNAFYDVIAAGATGTVNYSVAGLSAGVWTAFMLLDNNANQYLDAGDLQSPFDEAPLTVTASAIHDLTLLNQNAGARLASHHFVNGLFHNYSVRLEVRPDGRVPLTVTITSGEAAVPVDLGNTVGSNGYDISLQLGTVAPAVGSAYTVDVRYTDNVTETFNLSISAVLDNAPVPTFPVATSTGIAAIPTFTWTVPGGATATQVVDVIVKRGFDFLWGNVEPVLASDGAVLYNFDGTASVASLTPNLAHSWTVGLRDADGNTVVGPGESFTP